MANVPSAADLTRLTPLAAEITRRVTEDGRTLTEIATAAGLPLQYLSDVRHGRRGRLMPADHAARLLRALGVSAAAAGRILY